MVSEERPGDREYTDECEVYGWRAALVAARAMRDEWPCHAWEDKPRCRIRAYDARLQDAIEDRLY